MLIADNPQQAITHPLPDWEWTKTHVVLVAAASPGNAARLATTAAQLSVEPRSSIVVLHIEDERGAFQPLTGHEHSDYTAVDRVVAVARNYCLPCTLQTEHVRLDWPAGRRRRQLARVIERCAAETGAELIVVGQSAALPMSKSVADHLRSLTRTPVIEVAAHDIDPRQPAFSPNLFVVHR